jgi:hypothetical protein
MREQRNLLEHKLDLEDASIHLGIFSRVGYDRYRYDHLYSCPRRLAFVAGRLQLVADTIMHQLHRMSSKVY